MPTSVGPPATLHSRRFTRSGSVIAGLATVVAVWLGLAAPGISPVTPVPTAEQATVGTSVQSGTDTTVTLARRHHSHR